MLKAVQKRLLEAMQKPAHRLSFHQRQSKELLTVLLCLLALFAPSYKLTHELFSPLPENIFPKQMKVGSSYYLKPQDLITKLKINMSSPQNAKLFIGYNQFSYHPQFDIWFAGVGLKLGQQTLVHYYNSTVSTWKNFFSNPRLYFFTQPIQLIYPTKKTAPQLRLPAQVQQNLKTVSDQKRQTEHQQMKLLLSKVSNTTLPLCWKQPIYSKITSHYSAPRTLPSGFTYFHSGLDLRAYTGVPIAAATQGQVVFADKMTVPGNMVVIDHGQGLFSRYMHLDKILVESQQFITPGQLVGLAGSTGRVEAPHLHWEMIWKGQHLNPRLFIQQWNQKLCAKKSIATY